MDSDVTVEGVVVGDYEGAGQLGGFYIQDRTATATPPTSDGVFVFDGGGHRSRSATWCA